MQHNQTMDQSALTRQYRNCIAACHDCAQICSLCSDDMIGMQHHSDLMEKCTRLCRECADICSLAAQWMSRRSPLSERICALCAEVCDLCAETCEQHAPEHALCGPCAKECRRCAEACREMAGVKHR